MTGSSLSVDSKPFEDRTFSQQLVNSEYLSRQDSAERAFNKLVRTFTRQVEALTRYPTSGEQKVMVEHVTVNDGGQAIVGNVETHGGQRQGRRHLVA